MKSTRTFILVFLTCLSLTSNLFAATYYVDIAGSDTNDGKTLSAPWKTIGKANSILMPGDTVYLMPGTYTEAIKPARSGTEGNYITYTSYDKDNKATVDGVYDGADLQNRNYIILDGLRITNTKHFWVNMHNNSSYNIIRNCYMRKSDGWGGIALRWGANYNKILNNDLHAICDDGDVENEGGPSDTIMVWSSHHNLIEGNNVDSGTHMTINLEGDGLTSIPAYNIVRNNIATNPMHSNLSVEVDMGLTLIENNLITDAGTERTTNWCGSERDRDMVDYKHKSIQAASKDLIIRNNVMINNGTLVCTDARFETACWNLRAYNNTFYQEDRAIHSASYGGPYGNIFKNNIIHGRDYAIIHDSDDYSNLYFFNNNIMGGTVKFDGINSTTHWSGNLAVDPQFMDVSNRNLQLKSTSPMIDAGTFLTTTTNSGIGSTVINVEDARYFMDGWGLIEGDIIQLENQTQRVQVTNVDYTTNVITLDTPLTWTKGQGVSLEYKGNSPDIGAYEYGVPPLSSLIITGPPIVNESSSATYTASATWSDGSISTVTPLWSVAPTTYAKIDSNGVMTTSSIPAEQTVTVSASYTSSAVTMTAANSISITKELKSTLSGLTITGPTSVNESSSATYAATATWSDGSTSTVTPLWSENSPYTTIDSGGVLTALSVTADQPVTVSASYTSGAVTKTATKSVSITNVPPPVEPTPAEVPPDAVESELGTVTEPMQILFSPDTPGGSYIETTTSNSGSAVYSFNIVQPGTYKVVANVYTADAGSDSFLVKIDNGPDDIWDSNPTGDPALYNIWRLDEVTARGTGTFDAPQFDPLTVELEAGSHTITFSGREPNARLAYSYFMMESPAASLPSSVLLFRAESGELTAETMEIVSSLDIPGGSYITPSTSTSASAAYNFNIDQPGTYKIVAEVYSADAGSDSFQVKIDDDPEDIWDLNPEGDPARYNVWRQDEVTARGKGTFDAPQFDPLKVQLETGSHTITIIGRELDSRLAYFYLIMVPSVTKLIEAESGTLTAPMQVVLTAEAPGSAYIETSTKNSGNAVYSFNIIQPGNYKVIANVYGVDAGSDSFLVKIDNGPEDIWDLNPTGDPALYNIWRQSEITGRGTGTFDAPQFDPLTVELEAGSHTITFSGREPNARLDNFYLMRLSTEAEIFKIEFD